MTDLTNSGDYAEANTSTEPPWTSEEQFEYPSTPGSTGSGSEPGGDRNDGTAQPTGPLHPREHGPIGSRFPEWNDEPVHPRELDTDPLSPGLVDRLQGAVFSELHATPAIDDYGALEVEYLFNRERRTLVILAEVAAERNDVCSQLEVLRRRVEAISEMGQIQAMISLTELAATWNRGWPA